MAKFYGQHDRNCLWVTEGLSMCNCGLHDLYGWKDGDCWYDDDGTAHYYPWQQGLGFTIDELKEKLCEGGQHGRVLERKG